MVVTKKIGVQTQGHCDILDITPAVAKAVAASDIKNGNVTVFVAGSTAGVTTIEYEPGLVADLKNTWQRIAPEGVPYEHDARWGDGNGYAHVRSSLLGCSIVVPFVNGSLTLGTWQQIVLIDFDNRSRSREIVLQMSGE
ncbi:MAG: secondary thiamine-phosphate synthase enzyme YjbQ [Dehalococcoidia bacterium]|nr:secondary thiamine-phosphate synthase enzyme YjbQ [Dehalococcoidia bacterium]